MKKIILDTNFLMAIGRFKIDILSELERICDFQFVVYIIDKTREELKKIDDINARLALSFIDMKNIREIRSDEDYVDATILKRIGTDYVVATLDKELKGRVKAKKVPVITIRKKSHLDWG